MVALHGLGRMEDPFPVFPFTAKIKHAIGATLLLTATALYVCGICAPAIRIIAKAPGALESPTQAQNFSMICLVRLLLDRRDYVPFVYVTIFSLVIPIVKFILMTLTLVIATSCRRRTYSVWLPLKTAKVLIILCKYQFVDAFAVIVLVTFINFVSISVEPLLAAQAYLSYCILSIITAQWLCHCYSETFKRSTAAKAGQFAGSLSIPLLLRYSPEYFVGVDCPFDESSTVSLDDSYGSTGLPPHKTFASLSPATPTVSMVEEEQVYRGFQGTQQDIRQRVGGNSCSPWQGYSSSSSADLPADHSQHRSEQDSDHEYLPSTGHLRMHRGGHLRALWHRASRYHIKAARPFVFLLLLVSYAWRAAFRFLRRVGGCVRRLVRSPSARGGPAVADEQKLSGDDRFESGYTRGHFSECLVRIFFMALLLCISTFALLVSWVRPVLEVLLVPGQQRGFAIETSTSSLGDVFWRLRSMGHLLSGCGTMFVFPLLATFVVYVTSIGTMVGVCLLQRSAGSCDASVSSNSRLAGGPLIGPCRYPHYRRRVIYVTTIFSYISSVFGDLAMPDVLSIGFLVSYFIVNNINFFGARLPAVSYTEPVGTLDRLLWNFSGFWAMMAFGVSAAQVHKMSLLFEDVSQEVKPPVHPVETTSSPSAASVAESGCLEKGLLNERGDETPCLAPDGYRAFQVDSSSIAERSNLTMVSDPTPQATSALVISPHERRRRRKASLFGVFMHGCIRVTVALALLLPIWLKPTEVIDVDLRTVNSQVASFVEYMSPLLVKILPQSFGDCASTDHLAPLPCIGSQPLAVVRSSIYEAMARWATGLKTTVLDVVRFDAAPNSRVVLKVRGKIKTLALSLRVGQCLYDEAPGFCPVVWDGTDGCCGEDVTFLLQISVECNGVWPYLSRPTLLPTRFSKLVITEKILGIFPVEVADITDVVEDYVSKWVQTYLNPENKWIHWTDREAMSLIEFLNLLLRINAPAGLRCPHIH